MAFKRTGFSALKKQKKEYFESIYKFSKKVPNFKEGSDVYVIPLGLENGIYETACHRVMPHKVDGQTVGFGGTSFATYVKCNSDEGHEGLCCQLAKRERSRCEDYSKRIISGCTYRLHLPILILGNSIGDDSKISYPITKVSILNDFKSESGLKFSYLDMASGSFMNDIVLAYGRKLKEEGVIDYEMDEDSEEFLEEMCKRLSRTIIKVHGISKTGFSATLKDYSFFPLENPTVASGSSEEEQKAVKLFYKHKGIVAKIDEFIQLFNIEEENLIRSYNDKDLLEYYNSALGLPLNTGIEEISNSSTNVTSTSPSNSVQTAEEKVEVIQAEEVIEDMRSLLDVPPAQNEYEEDPFEGENPVEEPVLVGAPKVEEPSVEDSLDAFEFDSEMGGDDFFGD